MWIINASQASSLIFRLLFFHSEWNTSTERATAIDHWLRHINVYTLNVLICLVLMRIDVKTVFIPNYDCWFHSNGPKINILDLPIFCVCFVANNLNTHRMLIFHFCYSDAWRYRVTVYAWWPQKSSRSVNCLIGLSINNQYTNRLFQPISLMNEGNFLRIVWINAYAKITWK